MIDRRQAREIGKHVAAVTALVAVVAGIVGVTWLVVVAIGQQSADQGSVSVRIDAEFVPQAKMVSQMPGRWVFRKALGSLLVISRVHSRFEYADGGGADAPKDYRPWFLERLWVSVPPATAPGVALVIDTTRGVGDVGYDSGEYAGSVLTKPCTVRGRVAILGQGPRWVIAQVDVDVNPAEGGPWRVDRLVSIPVTESGIHAAAFNADGDAPSPSPAAAPPAEPDPDPDDRAKLVGRWFSQAKRPAPEIAPDAVAVAYDVYLQLDDAGRCVMATVAGTGIGGGPPPGMKYGTYRLVDDWLIITVQKYVYDEPQDNNHLDALAGSPYIVLRVGWRNDTLTLTGDMRPPIGPGPDTIDAMTLAFTQRPMPDLRTHRPKPNRQDGFDARPEPVEVKPRFVGP